MKNKILKVLSVGTILGLSAFELTGCKDKIDISSSEDNPIIETNTLNITVKTTVTDTTTDIAIESNAKNNELILKYIDADGNLRTNELIFEDGKTTIVFPRGESDYTITEFAISKNDKQLYYRTSLTIYGIAQNETPTPDPTPNPNNPEPNPEPVKKYTFNKLSDEKTITTFNVLYDDNTSADIDSVSLMEGTKQLENTDNVTYFTYENQILSINKLAFGFGSHRIYIYYSVNGETKVHEYTFELKSEEFISDYSLTSTSRIIKGQKNFELKFDIKLLEDVDLKSIYINDTLYELVEGIYNKNTGITSYIVKVKTSDDCDKETFTLKNVKFEYGGYSFDDDVENLSYEAIYNEPRLKATLKYDKETYLNDEIKKGTITIENTDEVTLDSILINNVWYSFDESDKNINGNLITTFEINPNDDGKDLISTIRYIIDDRKYDYQLEKEFKYNMINKLTIKEINEGRINNAVYFYSSIEGTRFTIEFNEEITSSVKFKYNGYYGDNNLPFASESSEDNESSIILPYDTDGTKFYFDFNEIAPEVIGDTLKLEFESFDIIITEDKKQASYSILDNLFGGTIYIRYASYLEGISYLRLNKDFNVLYFRADSGYEISKLNIKTIEIELYDESKEIINTIFSDYDVEQDGIDYYITGIPERAKYLKLKFIDYTYDNGYYQIVNFNEASSNLIEIQDITSSEE